MTTNELTVTQFEALRAYAKKHGRMWKSSLRAEWENGRNMIAELQQVRNVFGPSWLVRFSFSSPRTWLKKEV
jgi:hypothetical protein